MIFFSVPKQKKVLVFCEIDSSNFRNLFLDWTFFKISGPLCLKQKTKKGEISWKPFTAQLTISNNCLSRNCLTEKRGIWKNISKTLLLRKGKDYIMLKFFPPFIVLKNKQILIMCSNLDLSLALFFTIR